IFIMAVVKSGDVVEVHYTGRLTTGEQFDSSQGREPLEFTVGAGQMISGFDAGVVGMSIGDKKTINIAPEEAYGAWSEENTIPFPKENLPADMQVEVGMQLTMRTQDGRPFPVTVHEVTEESVILDANHMLAGKELVFDIEMVSINGQKSSIILLD
ncbi:MAG TPA: peptidylprolyl isomerase, partial [Phnomibacter sp.]|nr:peptidylprolyl isomerase [Phnomibacter sp.]